MLGMNLLRKFKLLRIFQRKQKTISDKSSQKCKDANISCSNDEESSSKVHEVTIATSSQSSLKDLIAMAEQEILSEKIHLSTPTILVEDSDSCYNSGSDSEEDLYEEMNFNRTQISDLYMSMNFKRT